MQHTFQDGFLTCKDMAARLGVTRNRVYQLIEEGRIPAVKMGPRMVRCPITTWNAWLSELGAKAAQSVRQ